MLVLYLCWAGERGLFIPFAAGGTMNYSGDQTQETFDPDIEDCRALAVSVSGFAECQCAGPNACAYALPFGYAFLCRHPRLNEILEKTRKERPGADSAP